MNKRRSFLAVVIACGGAFSAGAQAQAKTFTVKSFKGSYATALTARSRSRAPAGIPFRVVRRRDRSGREGDDLAGRRQAERGRVRHPHPDRKRTYARQRGRKRAPSPRPCRARRTPVGTTNAPCPALPLAFPPRRDSTSSSSSWTQKTPDGRPRGVPEGSGREPDRPRSGASGQAQRQVARGAGASSSGYRRKIPNSLNGSRRSEAGYDGDRAAPRGDAVAQRGSTSAAPAASSAAMGVGDA